MKENIAFRFLNNQNTSTKSLKKAFPVIVLFIVSILPFHIQAQTEKDSSFTGLYMTYRPRAEFKAGYKIPHTPVDEKAFMMSHRADVTFRHRRERAEVYLTIRNADIWGDNTNRMPELFEAWTEYTFSGHYAIRAGRQRLMLDNERLIGQKNWTQEGISHDVITFTGKFKHFEASLIAGMNQRSEQFSGTSYPWNEVMNYKYISILHFKILFNDKLTLSGLNIADGFELVSRKEVFRYTNGGRITYSNNNLTATLHGYYQHGKNPSDIKLDAWYINPELSYQFSKKLQFRGGVEVFSGTSDGLAEQGKSFSTLYGSGHKFSGHMDYFTSFPAHTKGYGLINPYILCQITLKKNYTLTSDFHTFHALHNPIYLQTTQSSYFGFEQDITLSKKLNSFSNLQYGFSYMLPTQSFLNMRNKPDGSNFQYFSYIMLTVNPMFFSSKNETGK